jgi:hypothetical protein
MVQDSAKAKSIAFETDEKISPDRDFSAAGLGRFRVLACSPTDLCPLAV